MANIYSHAQLPRVSAAEPGDRGSGPPSTGDLAVALGRAAVETHRVWFFRADALVEQLYRGLADNSVGKVIDGILRADLVVIDELGFSPLDPVAANHLFRHLAPLSVVGVTLLDRAPRHHPLHRLPGDLPDVVEVRVVVNDDEAHPLGERRCQQVWQSGRAMVANSRQQPHHVNRSIEVRLKYVDTFESRLVGPDRLEVRAASGAVEELDVNNAAGGDIPRHQRRRECLRDGRVVHPRECALVSDPAGSHRQAVSMTSGLSRSRPSIDVSRSTIRRREAIAATSRMAAFTVAVRLTVPRARPAAAAASSSIAMVVFLMAIRIAVDPLKGNPLHCG